MSSGACMLTSQVSEAEGKELANQLKCAWVETSARHNANVGESLLTQPRYSS